MNWSNNFPNNFPNNQKLPQPWHMVRAGSSLLRIWRLQRLRRAHWRDLSCLSCLRLCFFTSAQLETSTKVENWILPTTISIKSHQGAVRPWSILNILHEVKGLCRLIYGISWRKTQHFTSLGTRFHVLSPFGFWVGHLGLQFGGAKNM